MVAHVREAGVQQLTQPKVCEGATRVAGSAGVSRPRYSSKASASTVLISARQMVLQQEGHVGHIRWWHAWHINEVHIVACIV